MIFLFHRWDMLVPWRVRPSQVDSSLSDYVTKLGGEEAWRWWLHGTENYWWLHFVQCINIYIYIHTMILYRSVFFLTFKCFFHETMNLVVGGFIVHNLSFRGAAVFSFFGDTSSYWRPGGWGEQTEAANFQTRLNLMSFWRQHFPHWARNFGLFNPSLFYFNVEKVQRKWLWQSSLARVVKSLVVSVSWDWEVYCPNSCSQRAEHVIGKQSVHPT